MRWLVLLAALSLIAQDDEELLARHAASAAAAMKTGDYVAAEKHNREVVRLRPQLAEAEVNLGLSLFLQKKYAEAIRVFESSVKRKPELENAWLFLGISRFNLNRPAQALPALQAYVSRRPDDFQGQYFLGLTYLALERYADAAASLKSARAIDPHNIDSLYHLAQSYLGQARNIPSKRDSMWPLYQTTVNDIAAVDPASFRIAQLRAGYYEVVGQKREAIRELEALLEHDPKVRGLHYTLGCLHTEAHEYDKAMDQFAAELRLDAPYPRTYFQLGHVYVQVQKPRQALPWLKKALEIEPESGSQLWVDMGRAYRLMNLPLDALGAFEKAIQLGERNASVYYQLAMAARSAGKPKRAREALEMSQRLRSEENETKHPGTQ